MTSKLKTILSSFSLNRGGYTHKERNSNFELMRILAMFAIVAHHSVVNSGITGFYDYNNITANMIFLQLWGMWGKTAINVFVLITGYFMCTSKLTWKRFLKMYLPAKFYDILFFAIFLVAGYETLSLQSIMKVLFAYIYTIDRYFTASFFAFYLLIPFMNVLLEKLIKEDLQKLIGVLLIIFTISSTFFFNSGVFHHVFWYVTLYFVAAYIRMYPNRFTESHIFARNALIGSLILAYASVLIVDFIGVKFGFTSIYYMVSDSNKLLALTVGVSTFLFFKNLKMKGSKLINTVASTTFGVLLIHANSDAMRQWLWKDFLKLPSFYSAPFSKIVLTYIAVMFGVFIVCSMIDYIRILLLERPVFNLLNSKTDLIEAYCTKLIIDMKERVESVMRLIKV